MTAPPDVAPARPSLAVPLLLGTGFVLAVLLRVLIGGPGVAQSPFAGLVFGGCLLVLALSVGARLTWSLAAVGWGLGAAALLCLPVLIIRGAQPLHDSDGFVRWAFVVTFVAVAEEFFLRGALYDAVADRAGETAAIVVAAVAFALLHVPLYGWQVLALDVVVGLIFGELRRRTGTPAAPAVAHVGADLAAWFLRAP